MQILYLGPDSGTSRHRTRALQRLGHGVDIVDPERLLPYNKVVHYWNHHTGGLFFENVSCNRVLAKIPTKKFDLAWVDCGTLVGPPLLQALRRICGSIVNYNIDDPFGTRDGRKWRLYLRSLPLYDLVVVVRQCNVDEAYSLGARRVLLVSRSADEIAHKPRQLSPTDALKWSSQISFIGTWMPERGPFLADLARRGMPLTIYGDRWHKAPEWETLRGCWRGPGTRSDDEYASAISGSRVCLGLLSKGNRDNTTTRSFEIPFLGSVLCAERTDEHLKLYKEGQEAVFWGSVDECADRCTYLLANPEYRDAIAERGRLRCLRNETTNEKILQRILQNVSAQEEKQTLLYG